MQKGEIFGCKRGVARIESERTTRGEEEECTLEDVGVGSEQHRKYTPSKTASYVEPAILRRKVSPSYPVFRVPLIF